MTKNSDRKINFKREVRIFLLLTLSAAITAFNLSSVLRAGDLLPGGFSGITVLVQQVGRAFFSCEIPFSLVYLPLNLIPAIIGFKFLGKRFTLYSFYVVALSSVLTDVLPVYTITYDTLLIAVFGGLISGAACTICLLQGASSGGTDFISIYYSEKKGIDTWNYIFIGNVIILLTAGVLFGFDRALYSIIYQFVVTQVLNTFYKRYQKDTLLIVTDRPEEVYRVISEETNHDATLIEGTGCYEKNTKYVLYSVVGRDQVDETLRLIREIDDKAFINVIRTEEINGFFEKPLR